MLYEVITTFTKRCTRLGQVAAHDSVDLFGIIPNKYNIAGTHKNISKGTTAIINPFNVFIWEATISPQSEKTKDDIPTPSTTPSIENPPADTAITSATAILV